MVESKTAGDETNRIPTVSVIMGVFNAESTIRDSIESILQQDFTDWELIICDDGSSDATLDICQKYAREYPEKFRILANGRNLRLPATLNRCLEIANGKYIARMDADDISVYDRFTKQVAVLDSNPSIDLVGTSMRRFGQAGYGVLVVPPEEPDRNTLRRAIPFCHATIMTRREVYEAIGGYNDSPRTARAEDLELWFDFYQSGFVGINLNEPLYLVREDVAAIRRRTVRVRWNTFRTLILGYRKLGYPIHCYVMPFLQLGKALLPFRMQQWYRRWQSWRIVDSQA